MSSETLTEKVVRGAAIAGVVAGAATGVGEAKASSGTGDDRIPNPHTQTLSKESLQGMQGNPNVRIDSGAFSEKIKQGGSKGIEFFPVDLALSQELNKLWPDGETRNLLLAEVAMETDANGNLQLSGVTYNPNSEFGRPVESILGVAESVRKNGQPTGKFVLAMHRNEAGDVDMATGILIFEEPYDVGAEVWPEGTWLWPTDIDPEVTGDESFGHMTLVDGEEIIVFEVPDEEYVASLKATGVAEEDLPNVGDVLVARLRADGFLGAIALGNKAYIYVPEGGASAGGPTMAATKAPEQYMFVDWQKPASAAGAEAIVNGEYMGTPWTGDYAVSLDSEIILNADAHAINGTITVDGVTYEIRSDGGFDQVKTDLNVNNTGLSRTRLAGTLAGIVGTRYVTGGQFPGFSEPVEVMDLVVKYENGNEYIITVPYGDVYAAYSGATNDKVINREDFLKMLAPGEKISFYFTFPDTVTWEQFLSQKPVPDNAPLAVKKYYSFLKINERQKGILLDLENQSEVVSPDPIWLGVSYGMHITK